MQNQRFAILILVTVVTMVMSTALVTSGVLFESRTLNNEGNVNTVGVGVYWEKECLNEIQTINWNFMEPGSSQDVTVIVRCEGNIPMTLNMTSSNWNPPSTSTYMTLTWNREGTQVDVGSVTEAVLTLSVSPNIREITTFDFDITITGTG